MIGRRRLSGGQVQRLHSSAPDTFSRRLLLMTDIKSVQERLGRRRGPAQESLVAHVLVGEPASTSPEHALAAIDRGTELGIMPAKGENSLAEQSADTNWPDRIHAVFKRHGIRQVGSVP